MLVHSITESAIPARQVPDDFPEGLPEIPPTYEETHQLLELWNNLTGIARLESEQWDDEKRCEYMVWMVDDGRQFRVMWDNEDGEFETDIRRGHPR